MIYLQLFLSYLKIGFFGFGGGYSMLSLIQHEVVVNHQWISNAALSDIIAISQMTPGPIAINSATYIGYTVAGFWGSVIATTAVCLPSLTLMVLITQFFLKLKNSNYMDRIMTAMRPSIIGMIAAAAVMLIFPDDPNGASMIDIWSWVLFAAAFVASLRKVNPINLIILSAAAGIAIYYVPTIFAPQKPQQSSGVKLSMGQTLANEHWRNFDLTSSEVIASGEFEQAWANYLFIVANAQLQQPNVAEESIKHTLSKSASNVDALNALFELGEKYLYNPNSPMRNDELFIPMLEFMIDHSELDPLLKIRPEALLKRASLNRVGRVANDFRIDQDRTMHQVEAPLTILYFYDPDCADCKRTTTLMARSELLNNLTSDGSVEVIATLTDGNNEVDALYDLKATPTLYLLDNQKRVLLKDATIETILEALKYRTNF